MRVSHTSTQALQWCMPSQAHVPQCVLQYKLSTDCVARIAHGLHVVWRSFLVVEWQAHLHVCQALLQKASERCHPSSWSNHDQRGGKAWGRLEEGCMTQEQRHPSLFLACTCRQTNAHMKPTYQQPAAERGIGTQQHQQHRGGCSAIQQQHTRLRHMTKGLALG